MDGCMYVCMYIRNNMGNLNHLKFIHTIPEQHNKACMKSRNYKKQPHASESTNLKELNIFHVKITLHVTQIVDTGQLLHYIL